MRITLENIVNNYAEAHEGELTKKEIKGAIKMFVDLVTATVADMNDGDTFTIPDLGTFKVVESAPRKGRNPRNPKEEIDIPASMRLKFSMGATMKRALNEEE